MVRGETVTRAGPEDGCGDNGGGSPTIPGDGVSEIRGLMNDHPVLVDIMDCGPGRSGRERDLVWEILN